MSSMMRAVALAAHSFRGKIVDADDDFNQGTIRVEMGEDWCLQAPAKIAKERMPIPGTNAANEPPGKSDERNWLRARMQILVLGRSALWLLVSREGCTHAAVKIGLLEDCCSLSFDLDSLVQQAINRVTSSRKLRHQESDVIKEKHDQENHGIEKEQAT